MIVTSDPDRVPIREAAGALDPLDAIGLEEAGDALGHLVDDLRLPLVRGREVEARGADLDAELRERVLGFLDRERGLYPGFRRDAADAEASASELRLPLDADRPGAELRGADRRGIAAGAAAEDCDVTFHRPDPTENSTPESAPVAATPPGLRRLRVGF